MLRRLRPRLTYANVAATLALVFAMGGSAVAASHYLITSKKQISPKALKEIAATGKPGAPGASGSAGVEGRQGATGATGATGVEGAKGERGERGEQGAEGKPSGNAPHWRVTVAKPGKSSTEPARVTLIEVPPFKLVGRCYEGVGGETLAGTFISTTEEGSVASQSEEGEEIPLKAGEEKLLSPELAENEPGEESEERFKGPYSGLFAAESKTGSVALDGAANEGVYLKAGKEPACYFSGFLVSE